MTPTYVFIPGLHGTGGMFRAISKLLPIKIFELPKTGPQDYAALLPWLESHKFPKAYVIVGESCGGPLALLHASKTPKGLKGAVLLGSFARMGLPFSKWLSYLLPNLNMASPRFRPVAQARLFSGMASEAMLDLFQSEAAGTSPRIYKERFQEVMRCDVRPCLSLIRVPVLSVRAKRDMMVPDRAEPDLKAISRLRQASIDAPHVIAGVRPRELAVILREFSASLK